MTYIFNLGNNPSTSNVTWNLPQKLGELTLVTAAKWTCQQCEATSKTCPLGSFPAEIMTNIFSHHNLSNEFKKLNISSIL